MREVKTYKVTYILYRQMESLFRKKKKKKKIETLTEKIVLGLYRCYVDN